MVNYPLLSVSVRLCSGETLNLEIHHDLGEISAELKQLRTGPYNTLFNSPAWLESRIENAQGDEIPYIVVARDTQGKMAFTWPMAITRSMGASILGWLGQDMFAVNLGCYQPETADRLTKSDIHRIFTTLRQNGPVFDAVHLLNQPQFWNGAYNPMLSLGYQPAPNANYERCLQHDFASLYEETFTTRERRNHARQKRRLHERGDVTLIIADDDAVRMEILERFFELKTGQLDAIGAPNPFADAATRAFYRAALRTSENQETTPLFFGLRVNGELVATIIGVSERERFTTLMSAITLDDIAKVSPGQQLLEELVHYLCKQGIETFDFGPGSSPQKLRWEMQPVPLCNSYISLATRARPATWLASGRARLMQKIKNNDRAYRFASRARARLIGR